LKRSCFGTEVDGKAWLLDEPHKVETPKEEDKWSVFC
jgi:hypothetical protein